MKKKIIYLCNNDGSDTRINKEIKSLSQKFDIYFLGISKQKSNSFIEPLCKEFHVIKRSHNSLIGVFSQILCFIKLNFKHSFDFVHIINEQLMVFYLPFFFKKKVVLDIFDSFFLKIDKPGDKLQWLKKIIYNKAYKIIVTDQNRQSLMPSFSNKKVFVVENYPYYNSNNFKITKKRKLNIFFSGTLNSQRGVDILENLCEKYSDIEITMAGWISDDFAQRFSKKPYVNYLGVITQNEAFKIASQYCSFIMCCYAPINSNNINASPNKIYDAIHSNCKVIINKEVKISSFVNENNLGIVLNSFYDYDIDSLYKKLLETQQICYNDETKKSYSWQSIEAKFLELYS